MLPVENDQTQRFRCWVVVHTKEALKRGRSPIVGMPCCEFTVSSSGSHPEHRGQPQSRCSRGIVRTNPR